MAEQQRFHPEQPRIGTEFDSGNVLEFRKADERLLSPEAARALADAARAAEQTGQTAEQLTPVDIAIRQTAATVAMRQAALGEVAA